MADELPPGKARPVLRILAGFGCLVFLAMAVLFFPLGGLADAPWTLTAPFGAVVGAVYCGRIAAVGRGSLRP